MLNIKAIKPSEKGIKVLSHQFKQVSKTQLNYFLTNDDENSKKLLRFRTRFISKTYVKL
ncbi:hypothetical protein CO49_2253 [Staphylococcus aureus subsp. aureus CO-49]|nr:hypothetical protein CO49_2253 [Staphylococcus aureus subsp. aureus CO-49]